MDLGRVRIFEDNTDYLERSETFTVQISFNDPQEIFSLYFIYIFSVLFFSFYFFVFFTRATTDGNDDRDLVSSNTMTNIGIGKLILKFVFGKK